MKYKTPIAVLLLLILLPVIGAILYNNVQMTTTFLGQYTELSHNFSTGNVTTYVFIPASGIVENFDLNVSSNGGTNYVELWIGDGSGVSDWIPERYSETIENGSEATFNESSRWQQNTVGKVTKPADYYEIFSVNDGYSCVRYNQSININENNVSKISMELRSGLPAGVSVVYGITNKMPITGTQDAFVEPTGYTLFTRDYDAASSITYFSGTSLESYSRGADVFNYWKNISVEYDFSSESISWYENGTFKETQILPSNFSLMYNYGPMYLLLCSNGNGVSGSNLDFRTIMNNELNWTNGYDTTQQTGNLSSIINTYIKTCTNVSGGNCSVPITLGGEGSGNVTMQDLRVEAQQYVSNFSFKNSESLENITPTCYINGTAIDYTNYETFGVNQDVAFYCSLFGYSPYSNVFALNSSITENVTMEPHYFNITFVNERTGEIVNDTTITLSFISDDYSQNYSTTTGLLYSPVTQPANYTLAYTALAGYGRTRNFLYELTNQSLSTLTLYLIDEGNSTETTVTVYDALTTSPIEGAVVYLMRYDVTTNSYTTTAMYSSDISGNAYFDIEHDNELYKFKVDYPFNTQKLLTEPLYVSSTTINLYINLQEDVTEDFYNEQSIIYSFSYSNVSNSFTLTYNDASIIATQYCLYVKKYGQYSKTLLNSSCVTANSGSIELGGLENNTVNYAVFTATISGKEVHIASSWVELVSDTLDSGTFGLFMVVIIYMAFVFLSGISVYVPILGGVGLVFAKMLGLLTFGWLPIMMMLIAGIVVGIILNLKK